MLVAAIASEYNPFHNGHAYHIDKTREAGASHVVAIMSGNFTQRGSAAIMTKHERARMALLGGVDLVIELPIPYAAATAQRFALGVVSTAMGMGCVDVLSFGCESGYLTLIDAASKAIDSDIVRERQAEHLSTGITFAKARNLAVTELFGDEVGDILSSPNDLLAVEYVRQLRILNSDITPFAVGRKGVHHDSDGTSEAFASASFLRSIIKSSGISDVRDYVPAQSFLSLERSVVEKLAPFNENKMEQAMMGVLRRMSLEEIATLPDISEGIENRIYHSIRQALCVSEIYSLAKSKRYTASRIRRLVMSAFLGLDAKLSEHKTPYIRVLGFNKKGREVLALMRQTATIPVSDSPAYLKKQSKLSAEFVKAESTATDLYLLGLPELKPCGYDFTIDCIRGDW